MSFLNLVRVAFLTLCVPLFVQPALAQVTVVPAINTVAGDGTSGSSGDGGAATAASLSVPSGVAIDGAGNLYIADTFNNRVRKVSIATGNITTIAGYGPTTYTGDGGQATAAGLKLPYGIALDRAANVYIADTYHNVIRKVNQTTGVITTYAGDGTSGYSGDGAAATAATLNAPSGVAVDASGNVYIADTGNNVVRKVTAATGKISTVAGVEASGPAYTGDGGLATAATLNTPSNVAVDASGNLYIADSGNGAVRYVSASTQSISTLASGLAYPTGVAVDTAGNVYVANYNATSLVQKIAAGTHAVTTYAGTGANGYVADGVVASTAKLNYPFGVAVDASGNVYIADGDNQRIREVAPSNLFPATAVGSSTTQNLYVTTNAQSVTGVSPNLSQNGAQEFTAGAYSCANPALVCAIPMTFSPAFSGSRVIGMTVTAGGGSYAVGLSGVGTGPQVALTPGTVATVAGTGVPGYAGDFGPATSAKLYGPNGIAVDNAGNVFIADTYNNRIRIVFPSNGLIVIVAGNGTAGFAGDGGASTGAEMNAPWGVAFDSTGNVYIADSANNRIRKREPNAATFSTYAGNGTAGFAGDGGAATSAELNNPTKIAFDKQGNLYIADSGNNRIRRVDALSGIVTTVAGNGTAGYNGDGIAATSAELNVPQGLALDVYDDIYIADSSNHRIRRVDASTGLISTVTGTGTSGYSGDSGLATSAQIANPLAVALDSAGNLYIVDHDNHRIRKVDAGTGDIYTIAGNGTAAYAGNPASATAAEFSSPADVALDSIGNVYIADNFDNVVRKIDVTASSLAFATPTQNQNVDSTDGTLTSSISNVGNAALTVSAPGAGSNPSIATGFLYDAGSTCAQLSTVSSPYTIASGTTCALGIDFDPPSVGTFTGTAVLTDNAYNNTASSQTVNLSGTGILQTQTIAFTPTTPVSYGIAPITLSATASSGLAVTFSLVSGPATLAGSTLTITGAGTVVVAADQAGNAFYAAATEVQRSIVVGPEAQTITFTAPASPLTYPVVGTIALSATATSGLTPTFSILSGGGIASVSGSTLTITNAGTVVIAADQAGNTNYAAATEVTQTIVVNQATPTVTWGAPAAITYGTALSATQLNATASVAGTFSYSPASGTVLTAGAHTLSVTFTPTDTVDYTTATGSVSITVNQATPTVTWATPSAITYGTALSATQLNATASTAGTFVYSPASGAVLGAGSQTLNVTFTPTDTTDYTTATGSVTLVVNKATPAIAWATPAAITYGTALSATQLNATTTPAGTFAYTPASGTVLTAGSQTLSVTFTPTDTTDYNSNTATVTLTVNQAVPTITWATPTAITYGTALSGTQLNATASVAGTLTYTPASGSTPGAGSQTLSVSFTPTDTTDYTTATKTVTLVVAQATPTVTWATPTAITYGTALSATQLNATASTAGTFVYSPASGTLTAGSHTLNVTFTPTDTTDYTTATGSVTLTVNQATPTVTWATPSAITYGTALSAAQLNATASVAGTFVYSPASGTLSAGSHTLNVTFTPTDTTDYTTATGSVTLTVNQATPTVTWATPTAVPYGTVLSATQLNATASVAGTFAYSPASGTTMSSVGAQTLSVTFTPTDTTDYTTATGTVTLTVTQATPSITWSNPTAITYGTALSGTQLNATGSVAGTFSYSPASGAVLTAGIQTLTATFTPTDTTDYTTATASVTLTVNQATPTITWAAPAAITYGTALSATQLNATAPVAGTYSFSPALGTVLTAGAHTLSVTFTPTDTTDYTTATANVSLTVNQATPTVSWATPAAITYGTLLSASQLNATASVPGTFVYSPVLGTKPNVGTQTLSVTFTPTDSTDYTTATGSVSLVVNQATPTVSWTTPTAVPYGTVLSATQLNATASVPGTFAYSPASGTTMSSVGNHTLSVTFTPTDTTDYTTATANVTLNVTQATPTITWANPTAITYGTALSGTQLNATASVAGTLTYSPALGTTPTAGTQTLTVSFVPTDTTDYSNASATVTLLVNQATPTITWANPAGVAYGTALSATQLNATASVAGTFAYSPALGAIPAAGTQTLSATFTPTDTVDYTTATASVSLVVSKVTPTITWATPAAIAYGTALSATQLNATASVNGTFSYTPALGSTPTAGSHTLNVTFTPTDTNDYNTATGSVTLVVNQATPTITWATPSAVVYGTVLSATQLNATASVAGTLTYTPAVGTAMTTVGNQTLSVTFTPTDTTDYTTATGSVTLSVTQATPTLTWPNPTAITYGTALSGAQLNATASVAGTFAYSPALGSVPTAGTQTLSVTFTPTNATDYTTATASVSLTVNKAATTVTWSNPASIVYGTALSGVQLNATASVPGTFAYSPASGSVPTVGTQTLSVTFTPTDSTDYNTSTGSVSLVVTQNTPVITWPTPAAVPYGTALSATQLDATTPVAGTFSYSPALGSVLQTLGAHTLNVTFHPTDTTDYAIATASVSVNVTQATPVVSWSAPTAITYGTALSAIQLNATANVAGNFVYSPASGATLTAGVHTLSVTFTPTDSTDYATATGSVSLSVNQATPTVTWATPSSISYGTALSTTQLNATASVAGTFTYSPAAGSVPTQGTHTLTATFTPTDTTDYTTATGSVVLTVTQAVPTITWAAPSAITYGTALSATQLNATASVAGTFTYSPALGATLTAGVHTLSVTFNPTDTTDYALATASVSLTVNKANSTVTWATPSAVPYGTLLSGTQLNATASVPGTFVYSPASGTQMTAIGNNTLSVAFTPTDTTDYNTSAGSVTVNVTQATPSLTWATPASIVYGTALSAAQLNATASVAGTFTYSPALGATLTAGAHTLSVTFTPTNATDYTTATASVTLTVAQATPSIAWPTPSSVVYGTALSATQLNASSTAAGSFSYIPALGSILTVGTQTLTATFTPTDTTDYASATASVSLTVTQATPTVAWTAPSAISYGTALSGTQLNATASAAGTLTYTPAAGTVLAAGPHTLSVTFTPTDTADYKPVTQTVSLTVNQTTPTIAWTAPSAITYGTALNATQLNASTAVAGTLAFSPVSGTVLTAGAHTLTATFTPTDTTDYTSASASVPLTVNQATPAIAWTTPSSISYGTALSATQLNASSTVAGTFSYIPALGSILSAGNQTLTATFTPTDTADYKTVTATVTLSVTQATPTVTWATPASSVYGTALGSSQLNATASVAGTFTYLPASGTVLTAGTHTLTVTFLPTDSTDYTATTANVTLTVTQTTPTLSWATPSSIVYGTALSAAQLNATATVPGTFAYSPALGTVLTGGQHTLSVTFTPTDSTDYKTATASVNIAVSQTTATVALTSSANPILVTNAVSFVASLASAAGTPTGTVAFLDGSTTLGTGTLSAGQAVFTTSTLAVGSHSITAVYSGDANFLTATSSAVTEVVQDFTIGTSGSGSTPTVTASPGGVATYTLTFSPGTGATFPANVNLTVSGLPNGAMATFTPAVITAGSGATTVTLSIQLPQSAMLERGSPFGNPLNPMLPTAVCIVLLPFSRRFRKGSARLQRAGLTLALALAGVAAAAGLSGCGGSNSDSTSAPTTYNVTVTATSGTLSHTTNLTLIVN